ncbi:Hypothetical protein SMAX5B_016769, partial [Scophthalmus maximus]
MRRGNKRRSNKTRSNQRRSNMRRSNQRRSNSSGEVLLPSMLLGLQPGSHSSERPGGHNQLIEDGDLD